MLLLIDNYDSFTYNLYQMLSQLGQEVLVYRNDEITISDIQNMAPDRIVISPGPGTPDDAGISCEVIKSLGGKLPILGVCLGMQCIGQVFGGRIVNAGELLHGKTSLIYHTGKGVFRDIPSPFEAVRYHSLVVDRSSISDELEIVAQTSNGLIMGLRHRSMPVEGVQFHPESVLTEYGSKILANFLNVDLKEPLQLIGA
ncbi:glutamine amidotransferase of anthranilate synthase [Thermobaculum terrenum ATCC BAA-798]|uniref:Glutamine amidotransferase of anthranilate synthase n=1 Tax=Thermobaculum terrenum (strain ATCC BAA-798 / CCMEE 7001 / YNP1) TaxID=525904 RepID=D1CBJ7_THET1|nr:aminodeoxychorismate/anthranilate synthase component II [Thermobaculum terrenum]ACZ42162.1 glutamine amidotransferase of anthranilate synthase [Thermobaculum terrenum ATCC BAA-798]